MFWQFFHPCLHIQNTDPELEDENNNNEEDDNVVEEEDEVTEKKRKLVSFPIRDGTVIISIRISLLGNTN